MKLGYARVSTDEQNLDLQLEALTAAGCAAIHQDKAPGNRADCKALRTLLKKCQAGDVLVVWKLDRLGRSLIDLVSLVEELRVRGVGLQVLTGQGASIDTTRPEGRMIFGIMASMAEFERELIRERTRAGMQAAKRRGVRIGRPPKLSASELEVVQEMFRQGESYAKIAKIIKASESTVRRSIVLLKM
ncbi:recombinase family protein [Oceanibaculum nanhaiense]|uniref:recombinase family protein n=1 Tax=Oceanibaculum nanhaiense TaxID=1909734 RepID=UPI003D2CF250